MGSDTTPSEAIEYKEEFRRWSIDVRDRARAFSTEVFSLLTHGDTAEMEFKEYNALERAVIAGTIRKARRLGLVEPRRRLGHPIPGERVLYPRHPKGKT